MRYYKCNELVSFIHVMFFKTQINDSGNIYLEGEDIENTDSSFLSSMTPSLERLKMPAGTSFGNDQTHQKSKQNIYIILRGSSYIPLSIRSNFTTCYLKHF